MPSPFPGMDPYLEQEWQDFHGRFLPAAAVQIVAQTDPRYVVKIEEHVYIHELPEGSRRLLGRPDIGVTRRGERISSRAGAAVLEAPAQVRLPGVEIERSSYLAVRDRENRRLVTVIELLSPANKRPGPDREQYLAKRAEVLASDVHFVELDLLRGGPQLPLEDLPPCDYYALVSRAAERPRAGVWPIRLRDPLPVLPIPLQDLDPDATLDLKAVLDQVYDGARYQTYIYLTPPSPPLAPDDQAWARESVPRPS